MTCIRCPGVAVLRTGKVCCSTWRRPDLPPAYGEGHPLRLMPEDGGVGCEWFLSRYKPQAIAIAATETALEGEKGSRAYLDSLGSIKTALGAKARL